MQQDNTPLVQNLEPSRELHTGKLDELIHTIAQQPALVSVIMPARNEEHYIGASLSAVLAQDYPADHMEIIVIDDGSTDDTRGVIARLPGAERITIIDGPGGCIPETVNRGIFAATGAIIVRVDAHNVIAPDYVRRSVNGLIAQGADNVGGRWIITGDTPLEQAIAAGMKSPFGVGSAPWRIASEPQWVDTVPFGAYWRSALLNLGGLDERLLRNEDYELNWRLRDAGGRILYDPAITSTYNVKRDWRGLWDQYHHYGIWKARVMRMHPRSLRARHFVAPAFVASVACGILLSLIARWARWLLALGIGVYLLAVLFAAVWTARREGWRHITRLPLIFAILHVSWGLGFWRGLVQPPLEPMPIPETLYAEPGAEIEIALE